MVAVGALIIAIWPSFPLVLTALVLQGITGGFLGLAIATISLGLVGHAALAERLGRNQRFASTGGVVAAGLMGLIAYFLSYRAIFFAAAALVLPLLAALGRIRPADIHFSPASSYPESSRAERTAESTASEPFQKPRLAHIRRLRVLVPDGQRVDAATC
jgi:MFS family permease